MWQEIFNFLERYSGVSYDFSEDFSKISGNVLFIEPYQWKVTVNSILKQLEEALDCVEEYGDNLSDEMPSKKDLKKIIASYVLGELIKNINHIKRILNIDDIDISDFDDLQHQIELLFDLVDILVNNSLDEILKNNMFEEYEDDDDGGGFVEVLGLHKNDMPNLSFTVLSIREDYFESLNEDDE